MTRPSSSCTLPTVEQPLREAEFDALFARALRGPARPGPTHLHLILAGDDEVEAATRDLIARETVCCSFFEFVLTRTGEGELHIDIRVPPSHTEVLDAMAARARAAAPPAIPMAGPAAGSA